MKKLNLIIFFTALLFSYSNAQSTDQDSDYGRISLTPYVTNNINGIPNNAKNMLQRKLEKIVTKNGLGGTNYSNRFILTANVDISSKNITATAPPMHAYTLEVTFLIGDAMEGTKFSTTSKTLKGVGDTEDRAYLQAIKGIKSTDKIYNDFIAEGKNKIIAYYNAQCDFIIKEAQGLADQNRYEEALFKLFSVPKVCKECYEKCIDNIKPIYQKHIDRQCAMKLQEATGIWNANQDFESAEKAAKILATIEPNSSCFNDVKDLSDDIAKRVRKVDSREWNYKLKELTQVSEMIQAYENIGVAWGENQPENTFYNMIRWW